MASPREPAGFLCSPTGSLDWDNHFLHFTGMLNAFPSHQPGHTYFKNNLISTYYFQQSMVCENNTFFKSPFLYIRIYTKLAQLCPTVCDASVHGGFSRQEHWSGLPFPSPEHLPNPGTEPRSPALPAGSFPSEPPGWCKNLQCNTFCSFSSVLPGCPYTLPPPTFSWKVPFSLIHHLLLVYLNLLLVVTFPPELRVRPNDQQSRGGVNQWRDTGWGWGSPSLSLARLIMGRHIRTWGNPMLSFYQHLHSPLHAC